MYPLRSVIRAIAWAIGPLVVLLIATSAASAATTLTLDPDRAAPGTRVRIYNACLGVTEHPASKLKAAFIPADTDIPPTDPSVVNATAKATSDRAIYVVVVPRLKPGDYVILLECLPGDWRTNLAEGGLMPLTVLAGTPDTSMDRDVGSPPSPVPGPAGLVLAGAGLIGGLMGFRRVARQAAGARSG